MEFQKLDDKDYTAKVATNTDKEIQELKRKRVEAFKAKLEELANRFNKTTSQIKEKEQYYLELATNRASESLPRDSELDRANQQQMRIQYDSNMRVMAETDNMAAVIE